MSILSHQTSEMSLQRDCLLNLFRSRELVDHTWHAHGLWSSTVPFYELHQDIVPVSVEPDSIRHSFPRSGRCRNQVTHPILRSGTWLLCQDPGRVMMSYSYFLAFQESTRKKKGKLYSCIFVRNRIKKSTA